MKGFVFLGLLAAPLVLAQVKQDSIFESEIEAISFTKRLPISKEIINVEKDLGHKNMGWDLPILLKNQTSVVSTSDAGNGIGYTGFRIRGVGGTAINVMMNGVPYNDSESQGTFFVDVPDLTSSASQIVIQRGVGTSTNGVSAFGASVNVISKDPAEDFYVKSDNSVGSFSTYKVSGEIGSGLFWKDRMSIMGRYTKIYSDGYLDRASSNLDSYNFTAKYKQGSTELRLLAFGGYEETYQAWNGIDKATWEKDPKFNYSGAIYNEDWSEIIGFYDNEVDSYRQNHFQLLWQEKIADDWKLETTLHYTKGKGYYENYKQGELYSKYAFSGYGADETSDFIRKKWLDNDFYGIVSTLYGNFGSVDTNFGIVANQYYGRHYGQARDFFAADKYWSEYYRNRAIKSEISGFAKAIARLNKWEFFFDLQLRNIDYSTNILLAGDDEGANLDKNWLFFNPKAGLNYQVGNGKVFVSYAKASREPNRDDLLANSEVKHETLHDFEAGIEQVFGKGIAFAANLYYMHYVNQLVLNGQINNIGEFIRTNSGKSYRTGIELSLQAPLAQKWDLLLNSTISKNQNVDFKMEENDVVSELGKTNISFSPEFTANLSLFYKPIENLSVGITNQYVGSQYLDNSNNENLKLDAYLVSDFSASYNFALGKKTDMGIKFLLANIFNEKYVNNGYVYDRSPYYFAQAGTNFMLGVNFMFK